MSSNVRINNLEENEDTMKFTIENVNVSFINAIRRVLLSDIPCIVMRSTPYSANLINISINKTRLNNELLKQRISSVPIHVDDIENFPYANYIVEVDKKNTSDTIEYCTTEDFKIKNIQSNEYLPIGEVRKIFPPDKITGDYIDIARLRPKLSSIVEEEHLKFTSKLSIGTANDDGTFNVVSTASYRNTLNATKIKEVWETKLVDLKQKYSPEQIEFIRKDWLLLDAKRIYIENSFDFVLETIGIYNNFKLMKYANEIIIKQLYLTLENLKNNSDLITNATDILNNCFIIKLENQDYTVGKIIEFMLYDKYFIEKKELTYVGFIKKHPHDTNSIIKMAFNTLISKDEILTILEDCINNSIVIINSIKEFFNND